MIDRITENEEKLDKIVAIVKRLDSALADFELIKEDVKAINVYYGSPDWFADKEKYEQGLLNNVKAGVLSEDAVWDVDVNIKELLEKMSDILDLYKHK